MKPSQLGILPKIEKEKDQKKSRILVAIFLTVTLIPSLVFWLISAFRDKTIDFGNISFLSGNKNNIKKDLFESGLVKNKDELVLTLDRWAEESLSSLPGSWSAKIIFLNDNFSWGINDKDQFQAASLIKLPVVAAFYYQVERGEIDPSTVYVLKEEDVMGGAGSLQYKPVGTEVTLEDLATLALNQSDNTAFGILRDLVGDELINQLILGWGMNQTDLGDNLTSSSDISLFFYQLYHGQIIGQKYKEKMIADLTKTAFEDRIPTGVPRGIQVAHKVGTETNVISDAGIVFVPSNPFVLSILSEGTNEQIAKQQFPALVNDLYWIVSN